MESMHNSIKLAIATALHETINKIFPQTQWNLAELYSSFTDTPSIDMGHLSFACFSLAKICKKGPPLIAMELEKNLVLPKEISCAKAQGPYLNFFYHFQYIGSEVLKTILNGSYFQKELTTKSKKLMFEYMQPNTHKELHVGHMRNLSYGNALVRMNRYIGHQVIAATYPGDVGTHVAKCLWYLKYRHQGSIPQEDQGTWLGQMYSKANNLLDDEKDGPNFETNKQQLSEILKELAEKQGQMYDLWKETRQWSLELFHKAYDWADVTFDHWFFESEVDSSSLVRIKSLYEQGLLSKDQGAIGMDLSEEKLGFCLLLKSDGNGLYASKDIELAYHKFEQYSLDESYYVVDKRQSFHFSQVFATLKRLNFLHANQCIHLDYDFVELPDGPMSSRKGNIIPLMHLIAQMENMIKEKYLSKYQNEWSEQEINQTAQEVANGAIKYGMLRVDSNRKIVFNIEDWLKLDGETGPYLQYVHARIISLVKKLGPVSQSDIQWNLLQASQEKELMTFLVKFNDIVYAATMAHKTSALTGYLFDLGKLFNSFYAECSVANASTEELKMARLALSHATGLVMNQGLSLLGIPAPQRM